MTMEGLGVKNSIVILEEILFLISNVRIDQLKASEAVEGQH